jgi:hypothetical protein
MGAAGCQPPLASCSSVQAFGKGFSGDGIAAGVLLLGHLGLGFPADLETVPGSRWEWCCINDATLRTAARIAGKMASGQDCFDTPRRRKV